MNSTMGDERNGTQTYERRCEDCSFETQFEGDLYDLYDRIEAHQDEWQSHHLDHFVAFEAVSP